MFLIDSVCNAVSNVAKLTTKIFEWNTAPAQVAKVEDAEEEAKIQKALQDECASGAANQWSTRTNAAAVVTLHRVST